jgi:hypothetical protein
MEDDDRQVLIDDDVWEWAREQSGLDDPTPFLMGIFIEAMRQQRRQKKNADGSTSNHRAGRMGLGRSMPSPLRAVASRIHTSRCPRPSTAAATSCPASKSRGHVFLT